MLRSSLPQDSRPLLFPAKGTEDGSGEGGIFIGNALLSKVKVMFMPLALLSCAGLCQMCMSVRGCEGVGECENECGGGEVQVEAPFGCPVAFVHVSWNFLQCFASAKQQFKPCSQRFGCYHLPPVLQVALAESGIGADFYQGSLLCTGNVLVKKGGQEGELLLEGPLGEEFYRIRDVVYNQYHVC
jgi:hypothetical protein